MPRKRNLRMETYNKLISIGKSTEKDISNLKIEDLKEINISVLKTNDKIFTSSIEQIETNLTYREYNDKYKLDNYRLFFI